LKLGHFGVLDYFSFGAFSDDSQERNCWALRRKRAGEAFGVEFPPDAIYILGDTA